LDRLAAALDATLVAGPRSNAGFLAALCRSAEFRAGRFDTGYIDRNLATLVPAREAPDRGAAAAAVAVLVEREQQRIAAETAARDRPPSPWDATDGFGHTAPRPIAVLVDGKRRIARVGFEVDGPSVTLDGEVAAADARLITDGDTIYALRGGRQTVVQPDTDGGAREHAAGDGVIRAPMH